MVSGGTIVVVCKTTQLMRLFSSKIVFKNALVAMHDAGYDIVLNPGS